MRMQPCTTSTLTKKLNSVASARKRIIPTERMPLLRIEGVAWSAQ
jgi:hypothetical protein